MSYVKSILQPNERIIIIGKLHWIIYIHAMLLVIAGAALVILENALMNGNARGLVVTITAIVFGVAIVISFIRA